MTTSREDPRILRPEIKTMLDMILAGYRDTQRWDELYRLGYVDGDIFITDAGANAVMAHDAACREQAIERNVLPSLKSETILFLGAIINGTPLPDKTPSELQIGGLAEYNRDTQAWSVSEAGRIAYTLAMGRAS